MSSTISQAQNQAKSKIENTWKGVAQSYTVAWMGPIEAVEATFPHVSSDVVKIRSAISPALPSIIYQERSNPPENMTVAVPYEDGGDSYKCRLIATNQLTTSDTQLLAEFAQALWFLIDCKMLPSPREGEAFEKKLVEWTDESLIAS